MPDDKTSAHTFVVLPDEQDWISANWLVIRHRWLWRRLVVAFAILWLIYGALLVGLSTLDYGWNTYWAARTMGDALGYSVVVAAILIAFTMVMTPRRVRKQFLDAQRLTKQSEIALDAKGIRAKSAIGEISLAWGQVKRWLENERVIALMVTDREMILIPKSQIDRDRADFLRAHLVEAGIGDDWR